VVLAQEEARMLGHDVIGTEHLLLGLLHEEGGTAATALTALGVSLDRVRNRVIEVTGPGAQQPPGHVPFTADAKRALELALREAQMAGSGDIGSEHLLFGVVRTTDSVGARVLGDAGVDLERLRPAVREASEQLAGGSRGRGLFRRTEREEAGAQAEQVVRRPTTPSPLEALDDEAWAAVTAARAIVRQHGGVAVGSADLLAGIAVTEGPGARVLLAVGTDADAVTTAVTATSATGAATAGAATAAETAETTNADAARTALPLTGAARDALRHGVGIAAEHGRGAVGTADLLLALLSPPDERLVECLGTLGVAPDHLHAEARRHATDDAG
jgi:ATP-dependent Clp protease ATP-binding subunit ClpA